MAELPTQKNTTRVQQKLLTVGSKHMVLTIHETSDSFTLYIGGHTKYCIDCMILKQDSPFARFRDVSIAHLSHIYYNTDCTTTQNFERGKDTNMILILLMSYIKRHFPYLTHLSFTDTSYRICDNNQVVELAEMNYISTGKTWYEKNFNAFISPEYAPRFVEQERAFQEQKQHMTWELMKTFINTPLPLDENDMEKLFMLAPTWQAFFGPIRERIGISEFCIFLAPWLHRFFMVNSTLRFSGIPYIIPLTKTRNYNESEYTPPSKGTTAGGDRRLTRRAQKKRPICEM
jgi:hypothetical protein